MEYKLSQRTIPEVLLRACKAFGDRIAIRRKELGIWHSYTWNDYYETVKHFALGMKYLGLEKGARICIVGDNEPEWVWASFGIISMGGVLVAGCYPDSQPNEIKYILDHSGCTFVIVEDQQQVDKLLELKDDLPNIKRVIYWDPKGLWNYDDPWLISFVDVSTMGKEYEKSNPEIFEHVAAECRAEDLAAVFYTSGTTGTSKGVMLSQETWLASSERFGEAECLREGDDLFCLSPLGWIAEHVMNLIPAMINGAVVNFPEEPETVPRDLREIGYEAGFVGIRAIEAQTSDVQVKINDAGFLKRLTYNLFMPVGYRIADVIAKGNKVNLFWQLVGYLGYLLLFRPIKDTLGYLRSRTLLAGGSALAPDAFRYFRALGITLLNAYGLTEMTPVTAQRQDIELDPESAGVPVKDVEARISESGELLVRGSNMMVGYYKNPEATKAVIGEDGWLHTGDAGFIREQGELVIIDRVKDLMILACGAHFSPMYIENKLKFSPFVREAVILGHERDFVGALISIDFSAVGRWAERHGILYTTFMDLSQKPEIYNLLREDITNRVNKTLPSESAIRRFTLLPKELDADDAELTRTRKLRRGFVSQRYEEFIGALYSDELEHTIRFQIKYADGKETEVQTKVKIINLV